VLVCDVGGGTTDFSLIAVGEENGSLVLRRVAVGEHILLGGDNMDLALARRLQQKLEGAGHRIDSWQLQQLWHQCRVGKERLFEGARVKAQPVTILGRGTRLVGADARPQRTRRVGLQELSLPYAADAAITKHLARFLADLAADSVEQGIRLRRGPSGLAAPTHVLFNGGVMK